MIKKQNEPIFSPQASHKQPSVGVGEYYADPEREIIEWTAVYFEGKFYLSDPYSIAKLQEIQSEIDLQKKLANQFRGDEDARAESERSFHKHVDTSSYSCATEKSPQKMRLKQLKAEKQLYREEQIYLNKLAELKNKRKELQKKKGGKNLISIKKEETKSVKQKVVKRQSIEDQVIAKQIPQNQQRGAVQAEVRDQAQKVQLPKQSMVTIKMEQLQPNTFKPVIMETKSIKKSVVSHVADQSMKQMQQTKLTNYQAPAQNIASNDSPRSKEQSVIIRNLKAVSPPSPDILDMSSQAEKDLEAQIVKQRAGSSFFHQIHSQLYKLQHNVNNLQQSPEKSKQNEPTKNQLEKSNAKEQKQQLQHSISIERQKPAYRPSELIEDTKDILKQLNQGLRQMDEQEIQHSVIFKKTNISHAPVQHQEILPNQPQQTLVLQKNQAETKKNHVKTIQPKPKRLLFAPNIVSYQINESTRHASQTASQQKQKLQKEITLLQQVINELRVQRLKYQVSQNSRILQHPDRTVSTSSDKNNGTRNLLRLAESPPLANIEDLSHFNATTPSPMVESSVSQYHNASSLSKYKIARSKSGKIVKNLFSQTEMPKIDEQFIGQTHNQHKIEEKQINLMQQSVQKEPTQKESNQINGAQEYRLADDNASSKQEFRQKTEEKPKTQEQPPNRPQTKQPLFKIKTISPYPKHSSAATQHNNSKMQQANHQHHVQSDLQSSMPRTLINRYNHSNPPKITTHQHLENVKKRQQNINKQLLNQFEELNKKQSKYATVQPEMLDPKRRASREGILKNMEPKIPNSLDKTSNLKRKIYEMEQNKKSNEQITREQPKSRNFRTRRQSQSVRNSRASLTNKSTKSVGNDNRQKRQDNTVYVPALNPPSINHPLSPKENIIYEARIDQLSQNIDNNMLDVKKRKIVFSNIKMPVFPSAPTPNITVEDMVSLIKQLGNTLNMQFKDKDLHRLVMKKFKNCIMLDLLGENNNKLVWHYNQKIYLGGWEEATMEKTGEGIEYIPDKYFYKGEFVKNKRHGHGIMLFFNDSIYQGQWLQGQKDGKGKYHDKSLGLYYEGEWKEGKRNGIGYLEVEGQSRYEGSFSANYRTGYGSQKFSNDDFYRGEYKMGKFHGKGMYVWASGSSYEGDFCQGLKQGQGKWKSGSGELYTGQYFEDKKQGKGRFIWENGCIYQGEFAGDKKHGRGFLKYADGRQVEGVWKNGQMIQSTVVKQEEGRQQPLAYRKGQKFETVTIIKGGDHKSKKFSISGKVSNC